MSLQYFSANIGFISPAIRLYSVRLCGGHIVHDDGGQLENVFLTFRCPFGGSI